MPQDQLIVRGAREWLLQQIDVGLDLVFANEDEIRELFPDAKGAEYGALAQRLAGLGCTAAVKLGKDGAWLAHKEELHLIAPHKISDAVDSNGAGDAWAAGFLSGYLRGKSLPVCGAIASIVGAETVRHMGPIIPDTHWSEVLKRAKAPMGTD